MSKYESVTCSRPNCCQHIYLTTQYVRNVTKISTDVCLIFDERNHLTTVHYNGNKSTAIFSDVKNCCEGGIYVYRDFETEISPPVHPKSQPSPDILSTIATMYETTSNGDDLGIPERPHDHPSVIVQIVLVCLALFVIGIGTFLYQRYRKSRKKAKKRFPDHCEYSTVDELQITQTSDGSPERPATQNYFVLEKEMGSSSTPPPDTDTQPSAQQTTSSNYFTLEHNDVLNTYETVEDRFRMENSEDQVVKNQQTQNIVYNTLHATEDPSSDSTDNYSHFNDFNQEYNHLFR